jgi:hypothetical protein
MRTYFRTLFCVLLAVSPVVLIQVTAKPTRPAPPKEAKPATFPDIAGETNWGRLDVALLCNPQKPAQCVAAGSNP